MSVILLQLVKGSILIRFAYDINLAVSHHNQYLNIHYKLKHALISTVAVIARTSKFWKVEKCVTLFANRGTPYIITAPNALFMAIIKVLIALSVKNAQVSNMQVVNMQILHMQMLNMQISTEKLQRERHKLQNVQKELSQQHVAEVSRLQAANEETEKSYKERIRRLEEHRKEVEEELRKVKGQQLADRLNFEEQLMQTKQKVKEEEVCLDRGNDQVCVCGGYVVHTLRPAILCHGGFYMD